MRLKAWILVLLKINQGFNSHQLERSNSPLKLKNYSILSMMADNSISNRLLEIARLDQTDHLVRPPKKKSCKWVNNPI
jgi:hypothetical protein